jgi:hypothetical protein
MSIDSMPVCSDLVEMVPSIEVHVCVCVCLLMMLSGFESYVLYCIPWLTDHPIEPRWYGCVVRIRCGRSAVMSMTLLGIVESAVVVVSSLCTGRNYCLIQRERR